MKLTKVYQALTISILASFLSNSGFSNCVIVLMIVLYLDTIVSSLVAVTRSSNGLLFLSRSFADSVISEQVNEKLAMICRT